MSKWGGVHGQRRQDQREQTTWKRILREGFWLGDGCGWAVIWMVGAGWLPPSAWRTDEWTTRPRRCSSYASSNYLMAAILG